MLPGCSLSWQHRLRRTLVRSIQTSTNKAMPGLLQTAPAMKRIDECAKKV